MRRFDEVPLEVEFTGQLRIKNVPHVKQNVSLTGFEYTVRSSVEAKLADIYQYMQHNGIKEFDFNEYEILK
ncbi:hypothetical protein [Paenibacillus polymyxa]|uniref:Uncharacterized protein n=1 Tax=Paenibacillus polymyxa (strain SC2) TaxID=886882 RepID=E3EL09_PAEPS|nr:hypothetical protein [Paenibacillus polymyxa]ADO59571.1 hypothetical protein PPSC2_27240 [Paenibacillus polymyxa SC2]WPQ59599.1 hypothetical protein SKN87_28455 [Paenibacillus polymyxa]